MIFGDIVLAGIMGAAAYLQADGRGWKLIAAAVGLAALGFAALVWFVAQLGSPSWPEILSGPDELKVKALGFIPVAGTVLLIGAVAGALLGRKLSSGKVGVVVFVAGYLMINIIYFSFQFGART